MTRFDLTSEAKRYVRFVARSRWVIGTFFGFAVVAAGYLGIRYALEGAWTTLTSRASVASPELRADSGGSLGYWVLARWACQWTKRGSDSNTPAVEGKIWIGMTPDSDFSWIKQQA